MFQLTELNKLRFYISLDTKQVISHMLFPANRLASTEKANRIQIIMHQKHNIL